MNLKTTPQASEPDPKERRRHRRIYGPQLKLDIAGQQLVTMNWSVGGFLASGLESFQPGDRFEGSLTPPNSDQAGGFAAEVVRIDGETGARGCHFLSLSFKAFLSMSAVTDD